MGKLRFRSYNLSKLQEFSHEMLALKLPQFRLECLAFLRLRHVDGGNCKTIPFRRYQVVMFLPGRRGTS